jgi:excisionase family DNA binding protein
MNALGPELQPEGLSILEACRIAGIGRTKIYQAIADKSLKARKFGKRTIILRTDLQDFLARLPVVE